MRDKQIKINKDKIWDKLNEHLSNIHKSDIQNIIKVKNSPNK